LEEEEEFKDARSVSIDCRIGSSAVVACSRSLLWDVRCAEYCQVEVT
jgi:hypothetical protein